MPAVSIVVAIVEEFPCNQHYTFWGVEVVSILSRVIQYTINTAGKTLSPMYSLTISRRKYKHALGNIWLCFIFQLSCFIFSGGVGTISDVFFFNLPFWAHVVSFSQYPSNIKKTRDIFYEYHCFLAKFNRSTRHRVEQVGLCELLCVC